jgi:hypothetical protein
MSVHHLLATADPLGALQFAHPAAAHAVARSTDAYTLTAGRSWSVVAALLGVVGVVLGGLALTRSTRRISTSTGAGTGSGTGSARAVAALAAGLAGAVIGGLIVATADGGPGTGSGIVGGFVALVVGLIAMLLGGLALARTRRPA